jgi:acetylornithine deacetylase
MLVGMNSEVLQLCREMVAIPSINPQEITEIAEPFGEARMADFVFDWLDRQGLAPLRQTAKPGRDNVVAVATGADSSRSFLLCAHTDTVGVEGMTIDPFDPVVRDGRLYGRGSCDTKASLACMMIAFRNRVQAGDLPCNLVLLASCGEEYDTCGASHYARQSGESLAGAIFGEPTQLKVITAHKGVVRFRLTAAGQSAHSSTPQLGDNAIYHLSDLIPAIKKFADTLSRETSHPQLGCETLALTQIRGGHQINVIPDRCEALIDWRILPGRSIDACQQELCNYLVETAGRASPAIENIGYYAPMETDAGHRFTGRLLKAVECVVGAAETDVVAYGTDASGFAQLDMPSLVLGPGDIAQAHTEDEFIEIDQLEKGLAVHEAFLQGDWGV